MHRLRRGPESALKYLRTFTPSLTPLYDTLAHLRRNGLTATLFLIGTGLSRQTLKQVGYQPLLQGVLLWLVASIVTIVAIYHSFIAILGRGPDALREALVDLSNEAAAKKPSTGCHSGE